MYALNLSEDNRILSVTYEQYAAPGMPVVENIPDGDISNWKFVDRHYSYDPLPEPPTPDPTVDDIINALLGVEE